MQLHEIKTAQSLHHDRVELLSFVYSVMAFAKVTHQAKLLSKAHQVLEKLECKTMFIAPDQGVYNSL